MVKLLSNPDDKVISSLLYPVSCKQKESKGPLFIYSYQLFADPSVDNCIYWNPTALPAVEKQHPQTCAPWCFNPSWLRGGIIFPPASELPVGSFFHTQQQQETPIPKISAPGWLWGAAPRTRSSPLGHPHPTTHTAASQASQNQAGISPYHVQRRLSPGSACRWHPCRWDWLVPEAAVGLPLITWGRSTGMWGNVAAENRSWVPFTSQ